MEQNSELTAQDRDLIRVLNARGLSERTARMYVMLMHSGAKTATELAYALHTNRMAIYRGAEDLLQEGLISVSMSTPARYAATPIDAVIDMLVNERAREMDTLQLIRGGRVDRAEGITVDDRALTFQMVKDTERATAIAKQLISHAGERVTFAIGAEEVLLAYRAGLIGVCENPVRTLTARGVTDIVPSNHVVITQMLKEMPSIELRHVARYRGLQYLTVDGEKSLVGLATDPRTAERTKPKGAFLYVMSPTFAQSLDATFAYLWNNAIEATIRLDQLAENT